MITGGEIPAGVPRWAPWETDGVTLHLVVEGGDPIYGACATYDARGVLRGPRIFFERAAHLDQIAGSPPVCKECVAAALGLQESDVEASTRARVAYEIRAELVCCDNYDTHKPRHDDDPDPEDRSGYHAICYWGEAAARIAECHDDSDECDHIAGTWFDSKVCTPPCDRFHDRCLTCDEPVNSCELRALSYGERMQAAIPPGIIDEIERRLADGTMPRRKVTDDG